MVRKAILVLLIIITVLMSYGGCDGDGGGDGIEPTPMPEASPTPQPSPEGCFNCPCDFFSVPMTEDCWEEPEFRPEEAHGVSLCSLVPFSAFFGFGMAILPESQCSGGGHGCCVIFPDGENPNDNCAAPDVIEFLTSADQVEDCRTCLEEYATELNDAGITVTGGPPYVCIGP